MDFWRCFSINNKKIQVNEEITNSEVRVIGADGRQLGLMALSDAIQTAYTAELDLVKIAPMASPPVCKIMDYGKFKFEQTKKEKEAKKNQKTIELKEIRLSLNIDEHDFNTKFRNAMKFLKAGNKVKVSVRFRGREMARSSLGTELLTRFKTACESVGTVDRPFKMEGRSLVAVLNPKTCESAKKLKH